MSKKVSPPFEGGVVGTIDYHIFTEFYFPTGVVDSLISSYFFVLKTKASIKGKSLKFFRSQLRNKFTSDGLCYE